MSKSIGIYINRETQEEYEILEESDQVVKPLSSQVKVLPSKKYITKSGIQVQEKGD